MAGALPFILFRTSVFLRAVLLRMSAGVGLCLVFCEGGAHCPPPSRVLSVYVQINVWSVLVRTELVVIVVECCVSV